MSYGKFKIDWKNFFLGFGALFVALILPVVSGVFSNIITNIRNMMPWGSNGK